MCIGNYTTSVLLEENCFVASYVLGVPDPVQTSHCIHTALTPPHGLTPPNTHFNFKGLGRGTSHRRHNIAPVNQ